MRLSLWIAFSLYAFIPFAQTRQPIPILIRCDDIGMCHSVNVAAERVLQTGMPVSMSVMVPCPWFSEAVAMLKKYRNASIGIHLTLNSEWKQYRWGPVAGAGSVPSLVDSACNFFPSRSLLFAHSPGLNEIEKELRAQIDQALRAGLKIDYLDHHMSAAVQTPETRALLEKLAAEYHLPISRYYGEEEAEGWYFAAPENKLDSMLLKLKTLQPGATKLFVLHLGLESDEMNAMEDLNTFGPKQMSRHRFAELNALLSPQFRQKLSDPAYRLVNYGMLNREMGLKMQKRPLLNQ